MFYVYDDQFDLLLGKFIRECQRIEHDVKIMYAIMLEGEYDDIQKDGNVCLEHAFRVTISMLC